MKKEHLKGKRVTVFGLGINEGGVGTIEFLEQMGVKAIVVTDVKKKNELAVSLKKLERYKNITYILGQHRREDFIHTDLVIKNPGIPWTNEYIKLALANKVPVEMDSSLFFSFCKNKIIGVTGTRGKTTTASMIAHILEKSGIPVVRVGISQTPVLGLLSKIKPGDIVVFELSSWRLSALGRIRQSPPIAVFTNLYPDHLNYYRNFSAYEKDKRYIYEFQKKSGVLIANQSLETLTLHPSPGETLRFSSEPIAGDGAFFREGVAIAFREGKETVLFERDDVRIPGPHNAINALSAALAAFVLGIPATKISSALKTFSGIPHRLEPVLEKNGVIFYNDTAATSPDGAIAALRSFDRPIILIAGGTDKRLVFGDLAQEILDRTKVVILLPGSATESLLREIRKRAPAAVLPFYLEEVEDMEEAVRRAGGAATEGDIVLLSPGAASFGLFKNEFDRGEQFRKAVSLL